MSSTSTLRSTFSLISLSWRVQKYGKLPTKHRYSFERAFTISFRNRLPTTVVPFKLADIGEGIREVTIKSWFVEPDQSINQFDDVCEVESDKASVTITSRYDGVVKKIYYNVGDVASVGSPLLDIEIDESTNESNSSTIESESNPHESEFNPQIQELQQGLETISAPSTENNPDKSVVEPKITVTDENIFSQGDPEPRAEFGGFKLGGGSEEDVRREHNSSTYDSILTSKKALATPATRRIAMEYKVDINKIKGTGKGGRVSKEDILLYLTKPEKSAVSDSEEVLSGYKKVMVKTMTESNKIPTLVLTDEFDVTKLNYIRKEIKSMANEDHPKITMLHFMIKAVSLALTEYPILNSSFDEQGEKIQYRENQNIGIAIDTSNGLVVPNIKGVQNMSIKTIALKTQALQKLAQGNALSIQDVSNGTFTLSNIGSIAGTAVRPLILPPQVAIGGIGRIQLLPRYNSNEELTKSYIVHVSWAADHRIIDGASVARFSNLVKSYLETPSMLLVNI